MKTQELIQLKKLTDVCPELVSPPISSSSGKVLNLKLNNKFGDMMQV